MTVGSERRSDQTQHDMRSEVPWSPLAGFVILLAFVVWQSILAIWARPFIGEHNQMGMQMALGGLGLMLLIWGFVRSRTSSVSEAFRVLQLRYPGVKRLLLGPLKPLLIGIPILVTYVIVQSIVLQYFNIRPPPQPIARWFQQQARAGLNPRLMFLISLAVVGAPVTEELLFRGIIYLPMKREYGAFRAAIAVSLIFAGIHGYAAGLGHLFILALILTWLLEATNTMLWPIVAHALHNAGMIALMFLHP